MELQWFAVWQSKSGFLMVREKVHISLENETAFQIENLGAYFWIFDDIRILASFSQDYWIVQLILQPFITNGIIAILKMKSVICGETPYI